MISTDGLSSFARFFLIVNPEVLALVRFLGIVLGFTFAFALISYCLLCDIRNLKEISKIYKENKKGDEIYLQ